MRETRCDSSGSPATFSVGEPRWVLDVDFNGPEPDGLLSVLTPEWMTSTPTWRFRLRDADGNSCLADFVRFEVPRVALMRIDWETWEPHK